MPFKTMVSSLEEYGFVAYSNLHDTLSYQFFNLSIIIAFVSVDNILLRDISAHKCMI